MVLPRNYVGVIVCDTRRAEAWRAAFAEAGIAATVVETDGDEAEAGACKVAVARSDLPAANAIVTAVTRGERSLPSPKLGKTAVIALVVAAALVTAIVSGWL